MLLIGQPLGMFGFLGAGLADVVGPEGSRAGRWAVGSGGAGRRRHRGGRSVGSARPRCAWAGVAEPAPCEPSSRRACPPRTIRGWTGRPRTSGWSTSGATRFALADLAGRPAVVTFAFGHCADICPLVVRETHGGPATRHGAPRGARARRGDARPVARHARSPADLATRWQLGPGRSPAQRDRRGGGGRARRLERGPDRDPVTGDVAHPPLTYVVDSDGTIAFATLSGRETIAALIERL